MWPYGVLFALGVLECAVLSACALAIGQRLQILDFPDKHRKLHARATPRTGGLAVCATLLLSLGGWAAASAHWSEEGPLVSRWTALLALSTALLCAVGLCDDRWGMRARVKFSWQVVAVLPFALWARPAGSIDLLGFHLAGAWLTVPLVLFWLVSCTNFVNLMDGLDGLAATVGLTISAAVAALAWLNDQHEVLAAATALSGSLVGFLLHNWPPARLFLGDSGSLPLGFLVGALSLEASAKKAAGLTLVVPFALLAVPMFDTSMAILRRKLNGRKIGQGDREHIHHCLRDRGLSPTQTLLAIGGMCAATAAAVLVATVVHNDWVAALVGVVLIAVLIRGRVFGFNEMRLLLRHVEVSWDLLRTVPRMLRARFAVVRSESSLSEGWRRLWRKAVRSASALPECDVELVCERSPGGQTLFRLHRSSAEPGAAGAARWEWNCFQDREDGVRMRASLRASVAHGPDRARWLEVSQMLSALCEHWPVATPIAQPFEQQAAEPEGPPLLRPHWPDARRPVPRPETGRPVIGSDAA